MMQDPGEQMLELLRRFDKMDVSNAPMIKFAGEFRRTLIENKFSSGAAETIQIPEGVMTDEQFQLGGKHMDGFEPITPDGRTGFDKFGQLMSWTLPDEDGFKTGTFIHDVRNCTCYICGKGWSNTTEELKDQMKLDSELTVHKTCHYGHLKMVERAFWSKALIEAGFLFNLEEVPPRYPHSTPWQRVTILLNASGHPDSGFRIVVGRRKNVWELRLHRINMEQDFKDVTDTKGYEDFKFSEAGDPEFGPYFYVHAWSRDQVVDYLKRFHRAIPACISRIP